MSKILDQLELTCSENDAAKIISAAIKVVGAAHEGTVVELPCKVGGTVWIVKGCRVRECIVRGILHDSVGIQILLRINEDGYRHIDYTYSTVYLTREAAEKRLESEK